MAAAGWDRVGVAAMTASGAVSVRVRAPLSLPEGVVAAFSSKDDSRKGGSCSSPPQDEDLSAHA